MFVNFFPPVCGLPFHFLNGIFEEQNLKFFVCLLTYNIHFLKYFLYPEKLDLPKVTKVSFMFYSRSFGSSRFGH